MPLKTVLVLALALMAVTSLATVRNWVVARQSDCNSLTAFFAKNPTLEPDALKSKVLPVVAGIALVAVTFEIVVNFGNLSGAAGALAWLLPGLVLIAAVIGIVLASALKARSSLDFERLGSQQF